jgi:hypothetical protein
MLTVYDRITPQPQGMVVGKTAFLRSQSKRKVFFD